MPAATVLRSAFDAAISAARLSPAAGYWPDEPPTVILAVGKAAPGMWQAARERYGRCPSLLITTDGTDCSGIVSDAEVLRAAHPVPDPRSQSAAERALSFADALTAEDHLLALISGGGSALLAAPVSGMTLDDKAALNQALLASGASIGEMNRVRRVVSRIKGGGLARAAAPARVSTLLASDVPGDDPGLIASGPTICDPLPPPTAQDVIARYGLKHWVPTSALDTETEKGETGQVTVAVSAAQSLAAAANLLSSEGFDVDVLGDAIEGEARSVAAEHARIALDWQRHGRCGVLLSGGETTVTVTGEAGAGGRNSEFALALAIALDGAPNVSALVADSDGIDGSGPHAGAWVDASTLSRLASAGFNAQHSLDLHDSASAFAAVDGLLSTGPTGVNVNDFRAILVGAAE